MAENAESACVLVVDDNEANRALAQHTLEDEGYRVVLAESGVQAIAAFETAPPDCILLDVRMPGTDGFDVCRKIKANPATSGIPVVLVTSFDSRRDFMQGLAAGADDVLARPVQRDELMKRVRNVTKGGPG